MNRLLDKAFKVVSELPEDEQARIALVMLDLAQPYSETEPLDLSHRESVLRGLAQAQRGAFSSDAEVEEAFRRFGDD